MTEKKPNPLVEVLKNVQKNPKVSIGVTTQVQKAKGKNQVTMNKPTSRKTGRGG